MRMLLAMRRWGMSLWMGAGSRRHLRQQPDCQCRGADLEKYWRNRNAVEHKILITQLQASNLFRCDRFELFRADVVPAVHYIQAPQRSTHSSNTAQGEQPELCRQRLT
jgi:hypothetical protein